MGKVKATGIYLGNQISVEVTQEDGTLVILMDDNESGELQKHLEQCLARQPAMGGTFFPEQNSLLAAFNVLQNTFFDSLEEITVEGEIEEIPLEDGKIY